MNTLLPTSIAGSLPKPAWLAQPETLWSPWKLQGAELVEGKQDALRLALQNQRQSGIDIISDGEQSRQHFVTTFIEQLNGVDFKKRKTVKIRNRYEASVPMVVDEVTRPSSVFVEDAKFLRKLTKQPIKWALPGPMTMVDTLFDDHYKNRGALAWEFAKLLNQEAKELEAAGVDIIQFDEPAFNVFFDEVNDWGIAALERAAEGLKCETAVHICYGYGIKANTDWKKGKSAQSYLARMPCVSSLSRELAKFCLSRWENALGPPVCSPLERKVSIKSRMVSAARIEDLSYSSPRVLMALAFFASKSAANGMSLVTTRSPGCTFSTI